MNLCPLCFSAHDNGHKKIDYDEINYTCFHKASFIYYCKTCKQNICIKCSLEHENHDLVSFISIFSNQQKLLDKIKKKQELIDSILVYKEYNEVNKILKKIKENFQLCLKIQKRIVTQFNTDQINYQILMNLKAIDNDDTMFTDLEGIINEKDPFLKFNNILRIYSKMLSFNYEQIDSIENENKNLKNENKELKESHDQIKKEIKDLKESYDQIKKENNDLCTTIQDQNMTIKQIEKEKLIQETKVGQLRSIEKKFLDLKKEKEKNASNYLISLKKYEDSIQNLMKQNKALSSEKEELEENIGELETKIEEL